LLVPDSDRHRVKAYPGDVSLPNLGLEPSAWQSLTAQTTRVIHSAATVRFDHTLEEARQINVEGTRRILDFAAAMPSLRSLTYVGTAYVAGARTGLILESELAVGQSYRNTYEQTKAEAEALVRSYFAKLPAIILRPSIIVGDSQTGATSSFKMMYWPLKIYARRLWRTVPGYPDAVLDIVPVDYVAAAVARLAFDAAAIGETVHLCAGPKGSATIQQIARRAAEFFHVPEPRYVEPKYFFAAIRPLLSLFLWGRKRRILRDGRAYRDYFTMRMQFDTTNADRLLQPAGLQPPPVVDYLDRLFHYCVASEWGRKPIPAAQ
jgi:long-chain acyl-CoA synthetase